MSIDGAKRSRQELRSEIAEFQYDFDYQVHLHGVALAMYIEETAGDFIYLCEKRQGISVYTVFRNLLEACVKYLFLVKEPEVNVLSLELEDTFERLKGIGRNDSEGEAEKRRETRAILLKREKELKALGVGSPKMHLLVKEITHSDELYDLFRFASGFTHAQWAALAQRYLRRENGVNELIPERSVKPDHLEMMIDAAESLVRSVKEHHHLLKGERKEGT